MRSAVKVLLAAILGLGLLAVFVAPATAQDDSGDDAETTQDDSGDDAEASQDDSGDAPSIAEVAAGDENFSTLVTAVEAAGLTETLADCAGGPFTVFAPTNDAFSAVPQEQLDALLADTEALTSVLTYHVVEGAVTSDQVVELNGQEVPTLQGEAVTVTVEGDTVMVNQATVVAVDVEACNGVVHVIDAVLLPPSLAAGGGEGEGAAAEGDDAEAAGEEGGEEAAEGGEEAAEGGEEAAEGGEEAAEGGEAAAAEGELASTGSESALLVIVAVALAIAGLMIAGLGRKALATSRR